MSTLPKNPMSPEEFPQQRITPAVSLPSPPNHFRIEKILAESVEIPVGMPKTAKYIAQVEWAWGPSNTRVDAYYLSTNLKRTNWCLWFKGYDDDWGNWTKPEILSWSPKNGITAKIAAIYLLLDYWQGEASESGVDHYHWINNTALLSVDELKAISCLVWPKDESG